MIKAELSASWASPRPAGLVPMSFPFLWQDARGVVWLRSQDGSDICETPVAEFQVGQRNAFPPPNSVAWGKRVHTDVGITLRNVS
jgi:hypothetical protein